MFTETKLHWAAALTLIVTMMGCSSAPNVQEFSATASSSDEVQRLSAAVQAAKVQQSDVLAPNAFRAAEKSLLSATELQRKGKDAKDILHEVAEGNAHIARAKQFTELARSNMEDVAIARQAAITAGAPNTFSDEFNDADDRLRDVAARVEKNDVSEVAEKRSALQGAYLAVELKSIKATNVGPARTTIELAKKEGAEKWAKQSLAIAEKTANDTEAFVIANPHQTDALKLRSAEATNAANHLLKITRAAKSGKNVSPEETALRIEKEQNKTQAEREKLAAERKLTGELAAETGGLKSERAFNDSFETARSEFTPDEAEVYRQGDKLVIRLRTLEFPVNESVLRGSNFPLLAKVAKVVKGFEDPSVAIEGHTDSNGGKAMNAKLSKARAQAISDYLVSTDAITRGKISVAGYGFDRPLASNKTAKGQAQNRRVDVVISPSTK